MDYLPRHEPSWRLDGRPYLEARTAVFSSQRNDAGQKRTCQFGLTSYPGFREDRTQLATCGVATDRQVARSFINGQPCQKIQCQRRLGRCQSVESSHELLRTLYLVFGITKNQ